MADSIYEQLYRSQEIYRPPLEATSAFLEVTSGCSYHKCAFCDFLRDPFVVIPLDEVKRSILLLRQVIGNNPRLHLLGCNPMCLPADHLLEILDAVRLHLPAVQTVSLYARTDDVARKTDLELLELRRAGLRTVHIGLESGSDTVLQLHCKGETAAEMEIQFHRLTAAGISYHVSVIPGLGGACHSAEHADQTAALLSRIRPSGIWCMALKIWPDTPLSALVENGSFVSLSSQEILLEERSMLEQTEMKSPCLYVDSTVLGQYTIMGMLPEGKASLLSKIDQLLYG